MKMLFLIGVKGELGTLVDVRIRIFDLCLDVWVIFDLAAVFLDFDMARECECGEERMEVMQMRTVVGMFLLDGWGGLELLLTLLIFKGFVVLVLEGELIDEGEDLLCFFFDGFDVGVPQISLDRLELGVLED